MDLHMQLLMSASILISAPVILGHSHLRFIMLSPVENQVLMDKDACVKAYYPLNTSDQLPEYRTP